MFTKTVWSVAAAAAIATAVWASGTRTLTSFGTLIADIWAAATRTLTAGTKDTEIDAIKAVTDKADDTLEDDGGTQRFTANALEQAPSGGGGGGGGGCRRHRCDCHVPACRQPAVP